MTMNISRPSVSRLATIRSNPSLRNYLENLEKGRPATQHSWLYENEASTTTLKRWMQILRSLADGNEVEKLVYQFDLKQLSKFGPQGEVPPIAEAMKTESFQEQYIPNSGCSINLRSLREMGAVKGLLRYDPYATVIEDMSSRDTLVTNSGWPYFRRRSTVVPASIAQATSGEAYQFPAIILFRSYNGKLRVVWMYPMSMNLIEYTATMPLQHALSEHPYCTPWVGFDGVKERFTQLWKIHPYAFGGDTTAMDAHMQRAQLQMVGKMCAPSFSDPTSMLRSLYHVSDIDLLVGVDAEIRGEHGIASGSGWTQLSETIFQLGMFDAYIRAKSLNITTECGMGIGDDYVWFFDSPQSSKEIVDFWQANGLPGKEEKQSNEENHCTFLQRLFIKGWWSRDNSRVLGGVYPTIRALNSLLNPEKFYNPDEWNSDMFCARCYMILENCVDHPLFTEFVKFVVQGQKDLLPFAKQSAESIDRVQSAARAVRGLNPSYNQEKMFKPMSSFTAIQVAKDL